MTSLGLPPSITALLFDLDGVLTQTAKVHAAAWKEMFDAFLKDRDGNDFTPFDTADDYDEYVDGKPREDGIRSFLESRKIELPDGDADDGPDELTIHGLGARKNAIMIEKIEHDGVEAYDGSVAYVKAATEGGLRRAVVSSSANCRAVLEAAGIEKLFEVIVDGVVAQDEQLRGKPAPDTFLAAAQKLDVAPSGAAVFEDALAGVEAGRKGKFGWVIGVDRVGQADALRAHGADFVVQDLAELIGAGTPE